MWTYLRNGCLLVVGLLAAFGGYAAEEQPAKLRVALITGGHGFEEKPFLEVFQGFRDLEVKHIALDSKDGFLESADAKNYDVFVLYNMSAKIPESQRKSFLESMERGAGFVVLHHAIANYPDWPEYAGLIGGKYFLEAMEWQGAKHEKSEYTHDIEMPVHVEDAAHPITKGLSDFTIHDEVYRKWLFYPDSHLLLSSGHPLSDKAIGWTRVHGAAKLCFLQLGHGPEAHANPNFRTLVERAILWSAGRLKEESKR